MRTVPRTSLIRVTVLCLLVVPAVNAQTKERLRQLESALPKMLSAILAGDPYRTKYELSDATNPFYLEGDYDGDKHLDYLVLLADRGTATQRGLLFLASRKEPFVLYDSGKIDHHPLDAWINCHWGDCAKVIFKGKTASHGRPVQGADVIMLRFGGPNVIWFWDGKQMRKQPIPGE